MKFSELIKNKAVLKALEESGYVSPTEIQNQIIPLVHDGKDVLGQSQTGTGKTLAFAGPILDMIEENKITQSLILAPTRELALQIAQEIEKYAVHMNVSVTCVYGSSSIEDQIKRLHKGSEIVIGTPGRVKDLIKRNKLKISEIKFFVLDEADEMLSMGFQEEIEYIFNCIHNDRQVLLFSATMPKRILDIAEKYMSNEYESVLIAAKTRTADNIVQNYYVVQNSTRLEALARILDVYNTKRAIIFVRTKRNADELLESMSKKGYRANVIHGDITQVQRIKTLDLFKAGLFDYLIATDVAARGIHVDNVEIVVNYNLPESNESYVHRIGRTGRQSKSGISVTLVTQKEESLIKGLEKYINRKMIKCTIPKKPEILSSRIESLISTLVNEEKTNNFEQLNQYLDTLSNEEMKRMLSQVLVEKLMLNIGSNFDVKIDAPSSKKNTKENRNRTDIIRVFMTVGKKDNFEKKDLLNFIEKKANVKEGTCMNVEILSTFTFMDIKKEYFDKIVKSCNNVKYKNRVLKIEKAKK